jgi:secretion/DNA translocation related CpaE-like protein
LVSADRQLISLVQASATATGRVVEVFDTPNQVRGNWRGAAAVLVGTDSAAMVTGLGLGRRHGVHVVGEDTAQVLAWSVPLGASALVLPKQSGFLSAILDESNETDPGKGLLLRLFGGSGGLGVTTLSAGLAVRAAKRNLKAALVELDPCGGGIDVLFGAEHTPGWRWEDLVSAQGHIGELSGQLPCVCGVHLVAVGRDLVADESGLPAGPVAVNAVISSLRRSHDLVVIDQGGVRFDQGDALCLVGAEVRSVLATRMRLRDQVTEGLQLVIRTGPGRRLAPDLAADTLGLPLVGVFAEDRRIPSQAEAGEPPGRAGGGRAYDKILDQVLGTGKGGVLGLVRP